MEKPEAFSTEAKGKENLCQSMSAKVVSRLRWIGEPSEACLCHSYQDRCDTDRNLVLRRWGSWCRVRDSESVISGCPILLSATHNCPGSCAMTFQLSKEAPSKQMTHKHYWERLDDGCPSLVDLASLGMHSSERYHYLFN